MKKATQQTQYRNCIVGIRKRVARTALVFATLFILTLVVVQSAHAQSYGYRPVYSFQGANTANPSASDGASPYGGLVLDSTGNLYGTTMYGGSTTTACRPARGPSGCGTVFEISPSASGGWTETVLYNFTSDSTTNSNTGTTCYDGAIPYGGLALGANGNLFGTTDVGGLNGLGTVFEVLAPGATAPPVQDEPCFSSNTSAWTEVPLHSFDGNASGNGDGGNPEGGLALDRLGNMYGTNYNTVFKVDPIGRVTTLYDFSLNPEDSQGNINGTNPGADVVLIGNNLFGTTLNGGNNGDGTAFELANYENVADAIETGVIQFGSGDQFGIPDGATAFSGLAGRSAASMSGLYGTTYAGGAYGNGTVYETNGSGDETVLYAFTGGADGGEPVGGLVRYKYDLYGTTTSGGAYGFGTVFKVSPVSVANDQYSETVLYSFTGGADGAGPTAGLVVDAHGNLYGTANGGGATTGECASIYGCGTVFQLVVLPTTTTALTSSAEPSTVGELVTFTATVFSETCATPPCYPQNGEQVNFTITSRTTGTTWPGTGTLSGGIAPFSISTLPAGVYLVTATYPGDSNLGASTAKRYEVVVAPR
jgi:uncharacterized repeat protein (TIGR03803 family)